MHFNLVRYRFTDKTTHGLLMHGNDFLAYTLEDVDRGAGARKVAGKTAIPMGLRYPLEVRQVDSPLTHRYRQRFPWFEYHIEIKNVPNFQYIYLHVGNDELDTDGCVLLGDTAAVDGIGQSVAAYERFYKQYYDRIKQGGCTIDIIQFFSWNIVMA